MIKTFKLVIKAEKDRGAEEEKRKEEERKKKLQVLNAAHHHAASLSIKPPPKPPGFEPVNVKARGARPKADEEKFHDILTKGDERMQGHDEGYPGSGSFRRELKKAGYSTRAAEMADDDVGCCALL